METAAQAQAAPADPQEDAELASLYGVLDEVGASYPLLVYVADAADEPATYDEETALDPLIFEGFGQAPSRRSYSGERRAWARRLILAAAAAVAGGLGER
ncbi:MAG: hypothetical protein AABM29_10540 [Actinomycetota bacterium]